MTGRALALLALGLVTLLVYSGVVGHEFLTFDDDFYVYQNAYVKAGLRPATILWALTDVRTAHYWHPLTWMSHMTDVELFGLDAGRHLATNVALHVIAAYLLWAALCLATRRFWESLVVAALFALHPQNVEAVAWLAARKDVLSTTCWCLALMLYVRHARRPSLGRLLAVLGAFVLSVMSKPTTVTLPGALLLIDYWPLRRASFAPPSSSEEPSFPKRSTARLLVEKLPFLVIALAIALITVVSSAQGTRFEEESLPFSVTVPNALRSYVVYLGHALWPFGLAAFYPHPGALPPLATAAYAGALLAVTVGALAVARTRPHLTVGWLWYLGTFVPVIQLVQNARHGMADRYAYIPMIGVFVAVVWEIGIRVREARVRPAIVGGVTVAFLAFFAVVSWVQVSYWRDTETLFRRALAVTEDNYLAHGALGGALLGAGRVDEAELHLREAIRLRPNEPNSLANLGLLLASGGETKEAIRLLRRAARIRPQREAPWYGLGLIYEEQGRLMAAERNYRSAVRANRFSVEANLGLAHVLEREGKREGAIRRYRRVLALDPGNVQAREGSQRLQ